MLAETWTQLSKTPAEVVVARTIDNRTTIWYLEDRGKGWRIYKVVFSKDNAGCNGVPERMKYFEANGPTEQCQHGKGLCWDSMRHNNGQRLTDQRLHRVLESYCA